MPDKEGLPKLMEGLKAWFAVLVLILVVLSAITLYLDFFPEWKKYEKEFYRRELASGAKVNPVVEVKQIWLPELKQNGVQRCITCHVGVADPDAPNNYTENPYKNPVLEIHKLHNPNKYGCTICHGGQGQATTVKEAHGHVEHWNWPMLEGEYIQASCTKCHTHENLPTGTEWIKTGEQLVKKLNCQLCHTLNGKGGNIGPELTVDGSKTEAEWLEFHRMTYVEGEKTMQNWIFQHFKNPQKIEPGDPKTKYSAGTEPTKMLNFGLTDEEAKALTIYVMSLKDPAVENIPQKLLPTYQLPAKKK